MRAIGDGNTRHASVDAGVVLAGKTRYAIVGIVTAGARSKAPADFEIARIVGVAAITIGRTRATWSRDTALQIVATTVDADLAWQADLFIVAKLLFVGTPQAEPVDAAAIPRVDAGVDAAVPTPIRIDARVAPRIEGPSGSGITTAGRRRNGKQHASKESHGQGAAGQPQKEA